MIKRILFFFLVIFVLGSIYFVIHKKDFLFWGVKRGNIFVVKLCIKMGADVNNRDKHYLTPLMYASYMGNVEMVELLLRKGADPLKEDKDGFTAFKYSILSDEDVEKIYSIISLFQNYGLNLKDIVFLEEWIKISPNLKDYLFKEKKGEMSLLVDIKEISNFMREKWRLKSMFLSTGKNIFLMVTILFIFSVLFFIIWGIGKSWIYFEKDVIIIDLIKEGSFDISYSLIKNLRKITKKMKDENGNNILILALKEKEYKTVDLILQKIEKGKIEEGYDILNERDNLGKTAIFYAIEDDYDEYIERMIEMGADLNIEENKKGKTPFMYLIEKEKFSLVRKGLYECSIDVNKEDSLGKTPIMYAAEVKDGYEIIEELIKKGAEINHKDKYGNSVLIYALGENKINKVYYSENVKYVANKLLSSICDEIDGERTLLEWIIEKKDADLIEKALAEQNWFIVDKEGKTPLIIALEKYVKGDSDDRLRTFIKFLIEKTYIKHTDKDKLKIINLIIKRNDIEMINSVVEKTDNLSLIMFAMVDAQIFHKRIEILNIFIERANELAKEWEGNIEDMVTVAGITQDLSFHNDILYHIFYNNIDGIKSMEFSNSLFEKIPLSSIFGEGTEGYFILYNMPFEDLPKHIKGDEDYYDAFSPVLFATWYKRSDILRILVKDKKLYVDLIDNQGKTALMYAVELGVKEMVEILLKGGADPLKEDLLGKNAMDYAREKGNDEIIKMLEEEINKKIRKKKQNRGDL